jgi:hypothetical protein
MFFTSLARIRWSLAGLALVGLAATGVARAEDSSSPSNEELYRMILELEGTQKALEREAATAKAEAAAAKAELARVQGQVQSGGTPPVSTAAPKPAWFGSADVLVWNVSRGGLEYVTENSDPSDGGNGHVHSLDPGWDAGFRGEIGWLASNGFDVRARGLFFGTDDSASQTDANGLLTPSRTLEESELYDEDTSLAMSDYDIDMHMIDLESGYRFDVGSNVSIRPFAAFRYVNVDQTIDSLNCAELACDASSDYVDSYQEDARWWGVGLMVGGEAGWDFGSAFTFKARAAGGAIGGRSESTVSYYDGYYDTNYELLQNDHNHVTPVLEASATLGYKFLQNERFSLGIESGYEFLTFINSPDFIDEADPYDCHGCGFNSGEVDLTFHGAFFRLVGAF